MDGADDLKLGRRADLAQPLDCQGSKAHTKPHQTTPQVEVTTTLDFLADGNVGCGKEWMMMQGPYKQVCSV